MAAEKRATDAALESPVAIIRQNVCYCQCCAPAELTGEEVAAEANKQTPWEVVTGSTLRWAADPAEAPIVCAEDPTRLHWLLSC